MIPTGAAIPDSTFALTYRLAELFGPTATLRLLLNPKIKRQVPEDL